MLGFAFSNPFSLIAIEIVRAASMIADPEGLVLTNFLLLITNINVDKTMALGESQLELVVRCDEVLTSMG